jgi:hypothetical protein
MSAGFADIASATVPWDIVHTLLLLLGICNLSSVHQRPTECMFSPENCPHIETVSSASEFHIDILDIRSLFRK